MPIDHQLCLLAYSYRLRLDECRQSPDHMDIYKNQVITMHRLLILSCLLGVVRPRELLRLSSACKALSP